MTKPVIFQTAAATLAVAVVIAVLFFGLGPSVLAGTLLYIVIRALEKQLPGTRKARRLAGLAISVLAGIALLSGLVWASSRLLGNEGLAGMLLKVSVILEQLRSVVPPTWQAYLPEGIDQVKALLAAQFKEHAASVTQLSMSGFHQFTHFLLATIVACLLGASEPINVTGAFSGPLYRHLLNFKDAVAKVFGAQIKVAVVNALATGTFLLLILPLLGYHIPFAEMAVVLTLVLGLVPVVGNLVSNTLNVLLALSVGPGVAVICLGFLVVSHKLEYLLCARFVGAGVGAKTWELLTAMIFLEAIFGPIGFVAAPVLYAWLKAELCQRDWL